MIPEQQTLLNDPSQGLIVPDDPLGVSTGERLRRQKPEVYALIVQGLAEGMSAAALSRATGVHRDTIRAVRYGPEHASSIGQAKERTKHRLARAVDGLSERLVEEIDNIAPRDLPLTLAITIDKLQLLDGAPTAIVERRDGPTHEDLNDFIDTMKRATPVASEETLGEKASRLALPAGAGSEGNSEVVSPVSLREHEGKDDDEAK